MDLTEWAHAHGIYVATAYRWHREGTLPLSAQKAGQLILGFPGAAIASSPRGGADLYAQVSSRDQRVGLDRQVARLRAWAAQARLPEALKAVGHAQRGIGPRAAVGAGSIWCGGGR